ncbi:MAG: NAD(P)H-dependent oxidoreductase subunit E [Oscillospiraceae bacterium]
MLNQNETRFLDGVLSAHGNDPSKIIAIMQAIQKEYRYLSEDNLCYVAKKLGVSDAKIYSVATFYENFSLKPKGKYVIKICDGTACHVRKSTEILSEFRKILALDSKKTSTDDMMFTLETVSCLGACGLAPVCTINDEVFPSMTREKVRKLIDEVKAEETKSVKEV